MSEPVKIEEDSGLFYFSQGNVRFPVDPDRDSGMVKSVAVLDKLNRGTWLALAQLSGFPINPFNEVMLKPLLMGVVQLAWFHRFRMNDKSIEKLQSNQDARVAKYVEDLKNFKDNPEKEKKPRAAGSKGPRQAQLYTIVEGAETTKQGGQLRLILDAMLELKVPVSVLDVVAKIQGQLKTKQPAERVVGYYFSQGQTTGLFKVVNGIAAEKPAEETAPAPVVEETPAPVQLKEKAKQPTKKGTGKK